MKTIQVTRRMPYRGNFHLPGAVIEDVKDRDAAVLVAIGKAKYHTADMQAAETPAELPVISPAASQSEIAPPESAVSDESEVQEEAAEEKPAAKPKAAPKTRRTYQRKDMTAQGNKTE